MEREQIIEVLECYPEKMICAIVENKRTLFVTNATVLSLIKELTEEIETLKKTKRTYAIVDYCADDLAEALEEIKKLTEECERLKEKADRNLENLKAVLEERNESTIVADTVKKMQERLKDTPIKVGLPLFGLQTKGEVEDYANELILQMRDAIDRIAKEMLNENTEEI